MDILILLLSCIFIGCAAMAGLVLARRHHDRSVRHAKRRKINL